MVLGPRPGALTLGRNLEVAREHGYDQLAAIALGNLGSGAGEIRRYELADRWLGEAVTWCAERDLDANRRYTQAWLPRCHFEQGRWSEAGSAAAGLAAERLTMTPSRIVALTVLGRLRARRGDPEALAPLQEAWELAARTGDLQRTWPVAAGRAELGFWLWRVGQRPDPPAGAARPYALQMAGDWRLAAEAWRELGCPYELALALADSPAEGDLLAALDLLERLGARPAADGRNRGTDSDVAPPGRPPHSGQPEPPARVSRREQAAIPGPADLRRGAAHPHRPPGRQDLPGRGRDQRHRGRDLGPLLRQQRQVDHVLRRRRGQPRGDPRRGRAQRPPGRPDHRGQRARPLLLPRGRRRPCDAPS